MSEYSLVHLTKADCSMPELIYTAARAGYECVSFRGIPTRAREGIGVSEKLSGKKPESLADDRDLFLAVKRASEETGVRINDTENARIFVGVHVEDYERDLEAVRDLGMHNILTNIWTDDESFYTDAFTKLCELAKGYDINVNLEFVTWASIATLQDAISLLQKVNAPNQGIVLDTWHFYRSHNNVDELKTLPKEWFRYLHISDCPAEIPDSRDELIRTGLENRLFPGEGVVALKDIVELFPNAVRGLEIPNRKRIEQVGFDAFAKEALERARAEFD